MTTLLDTRRTARDVKRRRYQRPDGTRFTTLEVPLTVLRGINSAELLRAGVKPTAIAHELGVSDQRVRQYRAEMGDPTNGTPIAV